MTGSYLYYPRIDCPVAPGVSGVFGQYDWIAPAIAAVTTAAATTYQLRLQAKAAKTAEHQAERDAAAAAAAAAQQASAQQAAAVQQVAVQQANAGMTPTGGSVLAAIQGVPTWAWLAGAGALALVFVMRRR